MARLCDHWRVAVLREFVVSQPHGRVVRARAGWRRCARQQRDATHFVRTHTADEMDKQRPRAFTKRKHAVEVDAIGRCELSQDRID